MDTFFIFLKRYPYFNGYLFYSFKKVSLLLWIPFFLVKKISLLLWIHFSKFKRYPFFFGYLFFLLKRYPSIYGYLYSFRKRFTNLQNSFFCRLTSYCLSCPTIFFNFYHLKKKFQKLIHSTDSARLRYNYATL
jgi:hypothetical protein